jgi:ribosomal protein S18 acetylase RimI-like enzyme
MEMVVRSMTSEDLHTVAKIHNEAFPNDCEALNQSYEWIHSKYLGGAINRYYVVTIKEEIVGYILWAEVGGFRKNCILELEQIAVVKDWHNKDAGTQLIDESLSQVTSLLGAQNRYLKLVEVTTGTNNRAQELYKRTLDAKAKYIKKDFFDEDEVVMISRATEINAIRGKRGVSRIPSVNEE